MGRYTPDSTVIEVIQYVNKQVDYSVEETQETILCIGLH